MNDKVAIVGSGLVGRAWAISFARGGHDVVLFDADNKAVANALRTVEGLLTKLEQRACLKGRLPLKCVPESTALPHWRQRWPVPLMCRRTRPKSWGSNAKSSPSSTPRQKGMPC